MRKLAYLVSAETLLFAGSGCVDWLTDDFPGWIWGIVFLVALAILLGMYWQDWRRGSFRRKETDALGPEIRLNDTTTYREQPDGSRIVTQTTLAKAVRIEGTVGETKVGGRAKPGRAPEDQS